MFAASVAAALALAAPAPNEKLPTTPSGLAKELTRAHDAVDREVDAWRAEGDPAKGGAPVPLQLEALYQQRIYRHLARHPRTARRTLRRLPPRVRSRARFTLRAHQRLFALSHQTKITRKSNLRVGRAQPADRLMDHYRDAQKRFRVGWHILAAVNLVETGFNRLRNDSVAGAQGPMQFIPSTWRAYGMGGDVHDPRDAIMGAANYLRASGAPRDYRRALYAYNPSRLYVSGVLNHARRMIRDRRAFYAYYAWQIFVRTPNGERRLTGPGT
ncbi:MAG TPA: lytic transglycosylase domain-containing protein [Solirubrobacteraceae bacterium]|nr:lytic transglycosylase domain-containing protein [Solirubrobacteraceae bacterium]